MNEADRREIETAEMKFLGYVAGYTHKDHVRNDNTRQKLKTFNLNARIQQNQNNCYEHILCVDPNRIPQVFTV
jgi:hypothetical protein